MKTEVKKIDSTKHEILISVSGEKVKNKFDDVYKRIGEQAKVKGFRPGHVPRDLLEKNFSSQAHEQVARELTPELYDQAVEKEKLDVIDLLEISDVKLEPSSISFKAQVEISPQVALKEYKGLKVEYKDVAATAEEVKRSLDSLKEARKTEALDDSFAKSLCYPNLAELQKAVERQVVSQKESQQRQNIENSILEQLGKGVEFKIPDSLVNKQKQELLRRTKVDLALRGVPKETIDTEEAKILERLEPEAKNQVRVYLILGEVAKRENIPNDENMPRKVMELLFREADWEVK